MPNESSGARPTAGGERVPLASVKPWAHTLVLTGELKGRSAAKLEAAMDALFEEGVTGITLDLRRLDELDSTGAAVVAFRCGLCKRRGYDFAVIPGSREMQRALAAAGVSELLPVDHHDDATSRLPALALGGRARSRSGH
jgi:anti-anti-sigma factor